MGCTTLLVGKKAAQEGHCIIARNDDSPSGRYTPKKYVHVSAHEGSRKYRSVLSGVEINLPEHGMDYSAMPNALEGEGIWAASGINAANVAMTATETITSNPRVLGADPLVEKGIGEEDIVSLVLPYIHSAREGVERLGSLLKSVGTYEMNGIAFADEDEIWWLETIGGHHWMARRVPDDHYVVMPNQLGIDAFDFSDTSQYLCSEDLADFIEKYHLDRSMDGPFCPRDAFGSSDDADHVYNTPRAWYMLKTLNPQNDWESPQSDDLPWCMRPEKKISIEDVKYVLSSHYQGTPYDPYLSYGDKSMAGAYRSIGINRNDFLSILQVKEDKQSLEWIAFASNAFNTVIPMFSHVDTTPDYVSNTSENVSTENFYWTSRLIAAMCDASYATSWIHVERYQERMMAKGRALVYEAQKRLEKENDPERQKEIRTQANEEMASLAKQETTELLEQVLYALSNGMKNAYARSDA